MKKETTSSEKIRKINDLKAKQETGEILTPEETFFLDGDIEEEEP